MLTDSVGQGFENGTERGLCILHKFSDLSWEDVYWMIQIVAILSISVNDGQSAMNFDLGATDKF